MPAVSVCLQCGEYYPGPLKFAAGEMRCHRCEADTVDKILNDRNAAADMSYVLVGKHAARCWFATNYYEREMVKAFIHKDSGFTMTTIAELKYRERKP